MCERCDAIRLQAALIMSFTFANQSSINVVQTMAAMYAMMRHAAASAGKEAKFNEIWGVMIDEEFKYLSLTNPIEPVKFDANFDVRDHMKKSK